MRTKILLSLLALGAVAGAAFATQELRQSTEVDVVIGPFVDKTDGLTPECDIDFSATDECHLMKADGAAAVSIKAATWADYPDVNGYYKLTLTTSHTDTMGPLTIAINDDSVCLPVLARFAVLDANAWDTKYTHAGMKTTDGLVKASVEALGGEGTIDVNVVSIDGNTATVDGLNAMFDSDGLVKASVEALGIEEAIDVNVVSIDGNTATVDALNAMFDSDGLVKASVEALGGEEAIEVDVVSIDGNTATVDGLNAMFDPNGLVKAVIADVASDANGLIDTNDIKTAAKAGITELGGTEALFAALTSAYLINDMYAIVSGIDVDLSDPWLKAWNTNDYNDQTAMGLLIKAAGKR